MTLPLPYVARDPDAQGNFDAIARQFPLRSQHLADGSVKAAAIATDAVGSAEIATDAVGSAEIATGAVGVAELATGIVLQLATTGTARKVAFGIANPTSPGATGAETTVTHGLGTTPVVVVATVSSASSSYFTYNYSLGATTFVLGVHHYQETSLAINVNVSWIAIG